MQPICGAVGKYREKVAAGVKKGWLYPRHRQATCKRYDNPIQIITYQQRTERTNDSH